MLWLLGSGVPGALYAVGDWAAYAADFASLLAASYSQPLPSGMANCREQGAAAGNLPEIALPSGRSIGAAEAAATCGSASRCVVPAGSTLLMDSSLNLAALLVHGAVVWTDATQASDEMWLCAGLIMVESGGSFNMSIAAKRAYVYVKANGQTHPVIGRRAFGGYLSAISVAGKPLARTWSLLAEAAPVGATTLALLHDPRAMGWAVGDRIALAPMATGSSGNAEARSIAGFADGNVVLLDAATQAAYPVELSSDALRAPEVVHLSRSVVITGDQFSHAPNCHGDTPGKTCTDGLHVMMAGFARSLLRISHVRVERCGQRGTLGRYCLHLHRQGSCPDCLLHGNAIEQSHQRGIVVHGTHRALVSENVLYDVRGANIYLEVSGR
jgi:hypothetical protein